MSEELVSLVIMLQLFIFVFRDIACSKVKDKPKGRRDVRLQLRNHICHPFCRDISAQKDPCSSKEFPWEILLSKKRWSLQWWRSLVQLLKLEWLLQRGGSQSTHSPGDQIAQLLRSLQSAPSCKNSETNKPKVAQPSVLELKPLKRE